MEGASSDAENNQRVNNSIEGQSKPKRQMKTPFQLETLEKAYALETYASETMRAELSEKLGLSDRQLQMWFCHRRLKDKKDQDVASKKPRKEVAAVAPPPDSPVGGDDYGSGSGSGSGSSPYGYREGDKVVSRTVSGDVSAGRRYYESGRRYYESPQSIMELRVIACVEAQLGEPVREDGPILGMEFDPLPPDAFGAPIAVVEQQKRSGLHYDSKAVDRGLHEYPSSARSDAYGHIAPSHFHDRNPLFSHGSEQSSRGHGVDGWVSRTRLLPQQETHGHTFSSSPRDDDPVQQRDSFTNVRINSQLVDHPISGQESAYLASDGQIYHSDNAPHTGKKRKGEETRTSRDVEANDIRIRKELERQDILRRKNEERIKKEMEKHDRERRKEEERLMRERQREDERIQREHKREMERRERFLQKEYVKAEKMKQKEEIRREKEAVRRQAAIEKAAARKIARESMELIEDEQLELMELAVARKGLPSIINLDYNTLQNLESFRDSLSAFPPKTVLLKRPFEIQPWTDSEEIIGNLFMVWRFLITFADVLGLWPFTLDEFVQAFHDYDSRVLGEIHVALLRLIIQDIEDVARTPSGLGANQSNAANPEGGHPHIVEGAYAWGFDIRNWQRHLNPLTWPEILRQFALSAGFGPQLKKRSIQLAYLRNDDEGQVCKDVISTLRNGSAAVNAVAMMQEKGLLLPRKSRHRLTPGTVKFAAFHVLSLEGGKGLNVLELAEKIQKSGLRDLTTSKTPEASISVALTRDAKLFERIAPSTYCVRAAYRKDPADAEAILSGARKKIQIFENGFLAGEEADDVEKDEDFECDVDEDPEVDDIAAMSAAVKNEPYIEVKESPSDDVSLHVQTMPDKDLSAVPFSGFNDLNRSGTAAEQHDAGKGVKGGKINQENVEIDESKLGESWVQGLTEGEYSDLSVEERLNALVTIIGLANEGNSIRAVLEERLEAANALKKQMWAEAQIDKGRLKEENPTKLDLPSFTGSKVETRPNSAVESSQSPLPVTDHAKNEASPSTAENPKSFSFQNNGFPIEKCSLAQDFTTGSDNLLMQQNGNTSKRSRSLLKSYIAHRAEEMYVYRSLPLGQDRRCNRYWQFVTSASRNDPGCGRIFVELYDGHWRLVDSEEGFDALLTSLDARGVRESHLRLMLQKIETSFKQNVRKNSQISSIADRTGPAAVNETAEMDVSPDHAIDFDSPQSIVCGTDSDPSEALFSFRIELGRNKNEKKAALKRYQHFQRWMWKECFNSSTLRAMQYGKRCAQLLGVCDFCLNSYHSEDTHCFSCHQTFSNSSDYSQHVINCEDNKKLDLTAGHILDSSLPVRVRLLRAMLSIVEVSVPSEVVQTFWTENHRKSWGAKLNASSSTEELLQILTLLESVVKRECLSSNYETTMELLGSPVHDFADPRSVSVLPWIPQTTAAVALRLLELDTSIAYVPNEKAEPVEDMDVKEHVKLPSTFVPTNEVGAEAPHDPSGRSNGYKRGRGGREQGRGKKWLKRASGYRSDPRRQNLQDQRMVGHGRGRRTIRRRPEKRAVDADVDVDVSFLAHNSAAESPRNAPDEWDNENVGLLQMDSIGNGNDENALDDAAQGDWERDIEDVSNRWMETSNDDADATDDSSDEESDADRGMSDGSDGEEGEEEEDGGVRNHEYAVESAVLDDFSD